MPDGNDERLSEEVTSAVGLGGWGDATQGEKKGDGIPGRGNSVSKGTEI